MSTLRSALDELRAEDLRLVGDDGLAADLDELEHATRILESERARRLAEFERRGAFAADGHLSVSSWLADRHRVAHSTASAQVRLARALEQMPATADALASGDVSSSAVGLLLSAREACPERFALAEGTLVDAARTQPVAGLRRVVASWQQAADAERAAEVEDLRFERRSLHVSPTLHGMVRVDGDLDPETGQTLITALRAVVDADSKGKSPDARTAAQRRADALGEICRRWLDSSDRPSLAGERPHMIVTIDLDSLERRTDRRCELEDAGPITAETARRWACDAAVTRVITDAASQPLDVGRRTKVVPPPLRRAVAVRDGGCRFPGCDRPTGWCDAHPGLNRSLQHLPQDERSAKGRVERDGSKTAACTGACAQLAEDEGPASRDDPARGLGDAPARHRQVVGRVAAAGQLGPVADGRRLPSRGLARVGCSTVPGGPDRDRPGLPAWGVVPRDRAPDRSKSLDDLPRGGRERGPAVVSTDEGPSASSRAGTQTPSRPSSLAITGCATA